MGLFSKKEELCPLCNLSMNGIKSSCKLNGNYICSVCDNIIRGYFKNSKNKTVDMTFLNQLIDKYRYVPTGQDVIDLYKSCYTQLEWDCLEYSSKVDYYKLIEEERNRD